MRPSHHWDESSSRVIEIKTRSRLALVLCDVLEETQTDRGVIIWWNPKTSLDPTKNTITCFYCPVIRMVVFTASSCFPHFEVSLAETLNPASSIWRYVFVCLWEWMDAKWQVLWVLALTEKPLIYAAFFHTTAISKHFHWYIIEPHSVRLHLFVQISLVISQCSLRG